MTPAEVAWVRARAAVLARASVTLEERRLAAAAFQLTALEFTLLRARAPLPQARLD